MGNSVAQCLLVKWCKERSIKRKLEKMQKRTLKEKEMRDLNKKKQQQSNKGPKNWPSQNSFSVSESVMDIENDNNVNLPEVWSSV